MSKKESRLRNVKNIGFDLDFNPMYPLVEDLARKARARIPGFAYDYLAGGCNEELNLNKNSGDLNRIELEPRYLANYSGATMETSVFGKNYAAPFGVAPVGLQGLMWPNSPKILASAAFKANIPFVVSTVTSTSIESIAEITEGQAWYQLYHPASDSIRDDLLNRAQNSGIDTLVVTADVPTFGYRPREFKSGLAMPPRMTWRNVVQILGRPNWAIQTLKHGKPQFETVLPYMDRSLGMKQLGKFMKDNFDGRITHDKLSSLRDKWPGKLIVKGVASEADAETCVELGVDGIIISNHGGRQLDVGESSVNSLRHLAPIYRDKLTIMMDGGIRSGPDIARCLALGAEFMFMGRPFMLGVAALGQKGGDHVISIMKLQLLQVLQQLGCPDIEGLSRHLIHPT